MSVHFKESHLNLLCSDCLWFAKDVKQIDKVLKSFEEDGDKYNCEMSNEGTVTEYLGINITNWRWRVQTDPTGSDTESSRSYRHD